MDEMFSGPHAVRWFQRKIRSRADQQWSRWHWTKDGCWTICGVSVNIVGGNGGPLLPECDDERTRVTCMHCRARLALATTNTDTP